jgi:6-phosphogluconolactonase
MVAEIIVVNDVTSAALELVTSAMLAAVGAHGRAVLCLSGGSTPVPLYQRLAQRHDLPWSDTVLTWGDERYVKHDHPDSNYGAARRVLVDHVDVRPANVLPWPEGPTPDEAAAAYRRSLDSRLGDARTFDVNIMGLGPDGHTASLFPGTGAAVRTEDTFALDAPGFGWRLTMGARRLSDSSLTLFVVSGEEKRRALEDTFGSAAQGPGARTPAALDQYPARAISARDRLVVVTDVELA